MRARKARAFLGLTPFAHTQVVLQGHTSDLIADERVKQAYLGGVKYPFLFY
jgi:ABC-type lipopolysaccharide export system ATPase subunit